MEEKDKRSLVFMIFVMFICMAAISGILCMYLFGLHGQVQSQQDQIKTLNNKLTGYKQQCFDDTLILGGKVYNLERRLEGYNDFCINHNPNNKTDCISSILKKGD
jgi:hypothetical protein